VAKRYAPLAIVLALGFGALFAAAPARAQQPLSSDEMQQLFARANEAATQAAALAREDPDAARPLFQEALASYRTILRRGDIDNGYLHYNIGTTYLHMREVGEAIASYKRAQRTIPGDANLQRNLRIARRQVVDQFEPRQRGGAAFLYAWHTDIPRGARFAIGAVACALFWLVLLTRLLRLAPTPVRGLAIGLAFIAAACFTSLITQEMAGSGLGEAVIAVEEVQGRQGPSSTAYEPSFTRPLHEGVELRVLETRPGWLHVALPDGRETWLPETSVERV
jgi:tetratricopeptide (TPR) repeat protein